MDATESNGAVVVLSDHDSCDVIDRRSDDGDDGGVVGRRIGISISRGTCFSEVGRRLLCDVVFASA